MTEAGDDENGPKQRVLRRLGHLVSFFLLIHVQQMSGFKTHRVLNSRPERRFAPSFRPLSYFVLFSCFYIYYHFL